MVIPARKKLFRGFTLIELLIVIAILGILAAAVLVAVNPKKRQDQAKDANIKADVGSLATALQAYYTAPGQGSYPDNAVGEGLQLLVDNGDLKQKPTPPNGSTTVAYVYGISPGTCDLDAVPVVLCEESYVYADLVDDDTDTLLWCWESIEGKAEAEALAACTDFTVD